MSSIAKICSIDTCGKPIRAWGWCQMHYARWKNHGSTDKPNYLGVPKTHGATKMPEYGCWNKMKRRCYKPNVKFYEHYGGRGIKVCDRWRDKLDGFENFILDMDWRPSDRHSLDRIDNNGNYEPSNCRWATKREQAANTRMQERNRSGYKGVVKCRQKWSARLQVDGYKHVLGSYPTPESAAIVYDQAVIFFNGHGVTNFL